MCQSDSADSSVSITEGSILHEGSRNRTGFGKNVFQVHGVDEHRKVVLRKQLTRSRLTEFFAALAPLIGMEARGSSHHWGRKLAALGHTVRLMASQFVKPYVKNNKNDARDAEAICEAVSRPSMRFVPLKTPSNRCSWPCTRGRAGLTKARTACANQIRGFVVRTGLRATQWVKRDYPACLLFSRMPRTGCRTSPGRFLPASSSIFGI